MGRQLPIAATHRDEVELLRFISTLAPIRVFQNFAPTVEELWIADWERQEIAGCSYSIWPQGFPWQPAYGRTGGPGCPPELAGSFYVANRSAAPVLELSRSYLEERRYGRIYWARDFSAPAGLAYDAAAFARLVDQVWRWVRRLGRRPPEDPHTVTPYFLPDAWSRFGAPGA